MEMGTYGGAAAILSVIAADAHRVATGGREDTGGSRAGRGGRAAVRGT